MLTQLNWLMRLAHAMETRQCARQLTLGWECGKQARSRQTEQQCEQTWQLDRDRSGCFTSTQVMQEGIFCMHIYTIIIWIHTYLILCVSTLYTCQMQWCGFYFFTHLSRETRLTTLRHRAVERRPTETQPQRDANCSPKSISF